MGEESYYVKNKDLLDEIIKYKSTFKIDKDGNKIPGTGKMSDTLGQMIVKIVNGLSQKPNFYGYTFKDDMRSEALLTVLKYLHNFNEEKSSNPFAYITQIAFNSYRRLYNKAKKTFKD